MKTILIDDIQVSLEANGDTPRRYRKDFGGDLFQDLFSENNIGLEAVENVAYTMAMQANEKNGEPTMEQSEWLSQFSVNGIMLASPDIMEVWLDNLTTSSKSKKKYNR